VITVTDDAAQEDHREAGSHRTRRADERIVGVRMSLLSLPRDSMM
jgi:hypothetical protein